MDLDRALTWEEWEKISPGKRRAVAFHEAGHAAVSYMLGDFDGFEFISMGDDGHRFGFVRYAGVNHSIPMLEAFLATWRAGGVARAGRMVLHYLAGPCAESIHRRSIGDDDGYGEDWLWALEDEWQCVEGDDTDYGQTRRVAATVYKTAGRQEQFIRRLAGWADELFADPRVWGSVTALADRLTVADRVEFDEAFELMASAWEGETPGLPLLSLGRKWLRRFNPPFPRDLACPELEPAAAG